MQASELWWALVSSEQVCDRPTLAWLPVPSVCAAGGNLEYNTLEQNDHSQLESPVLSLASLDSHHVQSGENTRHSEKRLQNIYTHAERFS